MQNPSVQIKPVEYLHGEPLILWKKSEENQSITQQGLQLAVWGKLPYGKPVIQELRKAIPIQCEIKGPYSIGLIQDTHVLIKLSLMEDYIHLLSKPAFYLKAQRDFWQMRKPLSLLLGYLLWIFLLIILVRILCSL